jgi:cell division protein FtsI (penicillin-binding protein 3)/stage V sporulation protein D (sporulation-specific penicillin-binding protein)
MQHRTRAIWIMVMLACGFTLISFNLIQIQLVQHEKYLAMAIKNHTDRVTIPAKRGSLLDADGNVLAQTQSVYDIRLDGIALSKNHPEVNLPKIADALQAPLDSVPWSPRKGYQIIAHDVDDATATRLKGLKLEALIIEQHDRRVYPNNELAAHALGFTDENGRGLAGMEKQMDAILRGEPGERLVERDAKKQEIPLYQVRDRPAVDGDDVTLTIKMAIQHVVEDQLDKIVKNYSPETAYIMVMDPQTGEILAMGSRPTYDPNNRGELKPELVRDRCVTDPVEPGSVFKIITLAGALNEGLVNLNTQIFCENGDFYYAGKELHDDDERHGWLPVEEVMSQSSNIGFAKIALDYLHEQKLYQYATAFGMGQRTGLFEDQGETPGFLRPVNKWSALSITRVPMGQEVLASPIQLVTAMSVIANGGKLMAPELAKQVTDPSGRVVETFQPRAVRQVISTAAAREVAEALHQVTIDGTAKAIKITDAKGNGYTFAGKTGTAQKWIAGQGYSHTQHVASFIGFMPAEDPAFVALVMVDDPKTLPRQDYGAEVSAPVFKNIAEQMAQILNIPPDIPAPVPTVSAPPVLSANSPNHASL